MVGNFVEGTKDAIRTGLCNYLSDVGKGRDWINELSPVDLPDFGSFWNRVLCDRNEPLPSPPPPFTGGQCPGVLYRCEVLTTNGTYTTVVSFPTFGPITQFEEKMPGDGRWIVSARDANGDPITGEGPIVADRAFPIQTRIVRADGQPDTCGDPPTPTNPFPPSGDTTNISITYVNNEGDTITELGDLRIFAPVVIAPVNIVAPIRVELPDFEFNGTLRLAPEFEVNLRPPSFTQEPGDVDAPAPPEDPTTSPSTPSDDSERLLIGAIVTSTGAEDSTATQVFGNQSPDLFVPRLGVLSFRVRINGGLAWEGNHDIKSTRQFVPAPPDAVAVSARFTPIPNVQGTVTLVFRDSQPDP